MQTSQKVIIVDQFKNKPIIEQLIVHVVKILCALKNC